PTVFLRPTFFSSRALELVRPASSRAALAARSRSLSNLGFRDYAAADACGCGAGSLRSLPATFSDGRDAGCGQGKFCTRNLERAGLLPPRAANASGRKGD